MTEQITQGPKNIREQLLQKRLSFVTAQDSSLHVSGTLGEGSTATVYECVSTRDDIPAVLKVSVMREGISPREISSYRRLDGIPNISRLLQTYGQGEHVIAMRLQKIIGMPLPHITASYKERIPGVLIRIHEIIEGFHARGMLMPDDWLKEDNWLIVEDGSPYLIDLGEVKEMTEEATFEIERDFRLFASLVKKYTAEIRGKDKKTLERLVYRDLLSRGWGL